MSTLSTPFCAFSTALRTTVLAPVLVAAFSLSAHAAADPAGHGHCPHHHKLLAKFDANKDGKLDDAERAAAKAAISAHVLSKHPDADTNKDGSLTRDEFRAWRQSHPCHHGVKP